MGGASPYLGAVRAEHVGPAARSLRFARLEPPAWAGSTLFCQCGGPMYDREVRSGNSRRKVRNKEGTTTRRPSLTLLDPLLVNFRARVFHHHSPCRAAVRTCRAAMEWTYKAIRQLCIPPTVVISAPGLLVRSGMDTELRGFLHAEPGARLHTMAHSGALMLRFGGGDRERSPTRR